MCTPIWYCIDCNNGFPLIIHNLKLLRLNQIRNTLHRGSRKKSSNNNHTKHSKEHSLQCSDLITEFVDFVLHCGFPFEGVLMLTVQGIQWSTIQSSEYQCITTFLPFAIFVSGYNLRKHTISK